MEAGQHTPAQRSLVDHPFEIAGGYREIPDRPGIGVEINEEVAADLAADTRSVVGNLATDGSVTH
jgi:L-alanine-DL-glutamate epimerase-like enolase superfamily enzyme